VVAIKLVIDQAPGAAAVGSLPGVGLHLVVPASLSGEPRSCGTYAPAMDSDFDLWLEFEHIVGGLDDYCNVLVTLADGRRFAFNVWTYAFFGDAVRDGNEQVARRASSRLLAPTRPVRPGAHQTADRECGRRLDPTRLATSAL